MRARQSALGGCVEPTLQGQKNGQKELKAPTLKTFFLAFWPLQKESRKNQKEQKLCQGILVFPAPSVFLAMAPVFLATRHFMANRNNTPTRPARESLGRLLPLTIAGSSSGVTNRRVNSTVAEKQISHSPE